MFDKKPMQRNVHRLALASFILAIGFFAYESHAATTAERAKGAEQIMRNDARQIGASARQYFLEHKEAKSVTFGVDSNGTITGPLHEFVSRLIKGERVVDGRINGWDGTFSLQHDDAFNGKPVVFDCDGKIVKPTSK
jgi:hypothetical protein